jgi:hypothetical protein
VEGLLTSFVWRLIAFPGLLREPSRDRPNTTCTYPPSRPASRTMTSSAISSNNFMCGSPIVIFVSVESFTLPSIDVTNIGGTKRPGANRLESSEIITTKIAFTTARHNDLAKPLANHTVLTVILRIHHARRKFGDNAISINDIGGAASMIELWRRA